MTQIGPDAVLRPVSGLAVETFEDALLIWDESGNRLHQLDVLAATVWFELDGRPLGEVASGLARAFAADESLVQRDVLTLGDVLLTEGLVEDRHRSETHAFGREPDRDGPN